MSRNLPNELTAALFPASAWHQAAQMFGGLACAGLILMALALLQAPRQPEPAAEVYPARLVSLPSDEPPPPPREPAPPDPSPIVGPMKLEISPEAASAVRLQVPNQPLLASDTPPPARAVVAARFNLASSITRSIHDEDAPPRRIFSSEEVDQRPMVVYRVKPKVSGQAVSKMTTPRVGLLLVVNTDGSVGEVRVMHSSGEPEFDQAMVETVGEWQFSPAIRKGHKVRCWVEQMISVKLSDRNPFEAH